MLHHLMFVDPTLSNIGCSTSSNDIGPTQSNIVSPFITQHWLYCSAGSVWTKRDRFYLIKADSTAYIILRGGEGLLDISDLCLAIKWRLNGKKAESTTQKRQAPAKLSLVFSRRLHLRVPDNMFVSPLVGTRLHACSRQEAHLLTTNNLQLVSKFSLILGQISTTELLFKYWQRLLFDTEETRRLGRVKFRKDFWDRYWVRAVPSNSPRSLCEVNSPQFPFRSKVANVQWPTNVTEYKREIRKFYLVVVSESLNICVEKGNALTHPVTLIQIYISYTISEIWPFLLQLPKFVPNQHPNHQHLFPIDKMARKYQLRIVTTVWMVNYIQFVSCLENTLLIPTSGDWEDVGKHLKDP